MEGSSPFEQGLFEQVAEPTKGPVVDIVVSSDRNLIETESIEPIYAEILTTSTEQFKAKLAAFDAKAITVANAMAIEKIETQEQYDLATMAFVNGKNFTEEVTEAVEPARIVAYNLYTKILNRRKGILENVTKNLEPLGKVIKRFEFEKAEADRIAQIKKDEEDRKAEEERKLQLAAAAEQAGMSNDSVEAILEAPSTVPRTVVQPSIQRNTLMGKTRDAWAAEEDGQKDSLLRLVKAAAKNPKAYMAYLQLNQTALNAHARATKTAMDVPGYRAVNAGVLTRR